MKTFFFWLSPNFGPKTGLNLSEDLFFFWYSKSDFGILGLNLILGWKTDFEDGKRTGGKNLFWSSLFSNFLNFLAPPFENPAYATGDVPPLNVKIKKKIFVRGFLTEGQQKIAWTR